MEPPVVAGPLPDRESIFVDTTDDIEPFGEWDGDVFWRTDEPFPAVERLSRELVTTPTPTPTATVTPTPTPTVMATPTTAASAETPTAAVAPDRSETDHSEEDGHGAARQGGTGTGEQRGILDIVPWYVIVGGTLLFMLIGLLGASVGE